jgi:hypothetical protein
MTTPKEKAKELVDKFTVVGLQIRQEGYQCAIIAVDEILSVLRLDDKCSSNKALVYWWILVKEELQKL